MDTNMIVVGCYIGVAFIITVTIKWCCKCASRRNENFHQASQEESRGVPLCNLDNPPSYNTVMEDPDLYPLRRSSLPTYPEALRNAEASSAISIGENSAIRISDV